MGSDHEVVVALCQPTQYHRGGQTHVNRRVTQRKPLPVVRRAAVVGVVIHPITRVGTGRACAGASYVGKGRDAGPSQRYTSGAGDNGQAGGGGGWGPAG